MISFEEIVKSAITRLGVVRVANALNPLLYMTLVICPTFLFAAWLFADDPILKYGLVISGLLFPIAFLGHYTRFAFKDPSRLQSEEHLARMRELSIIARKGRTGPEPLPPLRNDLLVTEQDLLPNDRGEDHK